LDKVFPRLEVLETMLDLDALLGPISEDGPVGPDLRELPDDVTLSEIAEMRREVDPSVDPEGARKANWPGVRAACEEALAKKSKDIQVAAWLTESLARTEGFAGLAAGLDVIRELLERYWDDVHPRGEDDGSGTVSFAVRAGGVNWLSAARGMLPSVRAVGLLSGDSDDRGEWLGWEAFLEAQRVDDAASNNKARHEEMIAAGAVTMKRWRQTGKATPIARLVEAHAGLVEAGAAVRRLAELSEQRFPSEDAPSLLDLGNLLSEIAEWLEPKLPKSDGAAPEEEASEGASDESAFEGASSTPAPLAAAVGSPAAGGPITSRDEAFERLREVAEYFRDAEPHSPISFLVDRAVRWGNLTFPQLMQEIVKNDESLSPIWDVLGIAAPSRDDSTGAASASASDDASSSDESPSGDSSPADDPDSVWGASEE
jgi:type VI secretion system protein ImpA